MTKFLIFFLSILYLIIFIWFKFIRERLPRDIPFNLTLIGGLLLVIICCSYIKTLLNLLSKSPIKVSRTTKSITNLVYLPFQYLDEILKENKQILEKYNKIVIYLLPSLKKNYKLIVIVQLLYQITLVCVCVWDVFQAQFLYFYKCLFFAFIVYICHYIIYCLRDIKTKKILLIEERMDIQTTNYDQHYNTEDFFKHQTLNKINNKPLFPYIVTMKLDYIRKINKERNVKEGYSFDASSYSEKIRHNINAVLEISEILYLYDNFYHKFKICFIIISINYLVIWLYILYVSLYSLHISSFEFQLFKHFKMMYEDSYYCFSDINDFAFLNKIDD